jgi:outer membrane receptor protein involved in Fe transport
MLPLNNSLRPMTNWTRFFPMLLAAHRNLGTMCTASSASSPTSSTQKTRGPALSLMILTCLLVGAVIVAPARGDDQPGVVRGVVKSAESGEPLPGANVAVRAPSDSTLVGGATTDSTGRFVVKNLPTGEHTVVASFMGYEPSSRRVTLTDAEPTKTLGPMPLSATTAQMDGATVSAERPFVTTEGSKTVYNFEESQVALAGKSAVDVMQDLPSLRIDAMDGSIRLRGNQSVAIHVNGDPVSLNGKALVQYLRGLSGEDVKRVEVNTNPSARHDAEGTAGIVNIVLDRTEERGVSGGVSGSGGVGPRLDGSGHLGYDRGPWTLYGSYSYSHNERKTVQTLLRRPSVGAQPVLDQSTTQQQTYGGHSFNAEIEYALAPATTLSLTSTGNVWTARQDQRMTIQRRDASGDRTRKIATKDRSVHLDERLSLSRTFDEENHELSADLRYERDDDRDRVREERVPSSPREREMSADDEHAGSVELDYTRPQGEWTIDTGYKGAVRALDQRYESILFDESTGSFPGRPDHADALTFREQVHAGYGTLQRPVGPLDAEVGLRVEHTRTTLSPSDASPERNRYTDLFPSASLTYEMGQGRRVSLSYSRRIDRPSAHELSAFDASSDPYVRFLGNPNLEPEYIHKGELTVMQKVGPATVTVSPYARRKTNAIEWATVQDDSLTVRTYDNYDARTSYGAELTSSLTVGDAKATLSGNLYHRRTSGGSLDDDARNALAFMGRANVTWTLLDGLRLQVSQMYRSPVTTGLGRIDPFVRTSASLERSFWDDKGTLGLQVEDPFNTSEIGLQKRTDTVQERLRRDWDGRSVSVSFSYRFGDSDQKKHRGQSSTGGGLGMGGG